MKSDGCTTEMDHQCPTYCQKESLVVQPWEDKFTTSNTQWTVVLKLLQLMNKLLAKIRCGQLQ